MFALTYDLWREIVEDVVVSHQPLFEAMHQAADDLELTPALIEELKREEELALPGDEHFKLMIDFVQDEIEGFIIFLAAEVPQEFLAELMAGAAEERGFPLEELQAFELEHGLNRGDPGGYGGDLWHPGRGGRGPPDLLPGFIRQPGH